LLLLLFLQVQEQREQQQAAGNSALHYLYPGTNSINSCTALPAALPHNSSAWLAPALNTAPSAALPLAGSFLDDACPTVQSSALQTHIALHQQQQLGHQLCMQCVTASRKQHGRLSSAAQVKLGELMAVQQVQMRLQEELLLSLLPCSNGGSM
jgi:hypothetical protein